MDVGRGGVCTAAEAEVAVATSSSLHMLAAAGTAAVATAGRPTGIDYCCLVTQPKSRLAMHLRVAPQFAQSPKPQPRSRHPRTLTSRLLSQTPVTQAADAPQASACSQRRRRRRGYEPRAGCGATALSSLPVAASLGARCTVPRQTGAPVVISPTSPPQSCESPCAAARDRVDTSTGWASAPPTVIPPVSGNACASVYSRSGASISSSSGVSSSAAVCA